MRPSVLFGCIAGIGTIGYLFLCYRIDPELWIQPVIHYLTWIPFLVCMILALVVLRREAELPFKKALREAFIVYIIGNLMFYVFDYFMLSYIDPSLVQMIESGFEEWVASGNLDLTGEELEKIDHSPRISTYLLTFAQSLIAGFGISALLALFFKNE